MTRPEMTRAEIREILHANIGRQLRITFDTGMVQEVEIGYVDAEGFVHSASSGDQTGVIWRRFDEVKHIHRHLTPVGASMSNVSSLSAPNWVTRGLPRKRRRKSLLN